MEEILNILKQALTILLEFKDNKIVVIVVLMIITLLSIVLAILAIIDARKQTIAWKNLRDQVAKLIEERGDSNGNKN